MAKFIDIANDNKLAAELIDKVSQGAEIVAAKNFEARLKSRVFSRGQDANNEQIGTYSTTPMLVGSSSFKRLGSQVPSTRAVSALFGSKRKRAKRDWVTLEGKRLMVLENGYAEFRKTLGRQTQKVDLFLTGDLFRSIVTGRSGGNAAVGTNSPKMYERSKYNEERFEKVIFEPTKEEIAEQGVVISKILEKELFS